MRITFHRILKKYFFSSCLHFLVTFSVLTLSVLSNSALAQEANDSLGLVAYNYTASHISDYAVNGVGGGNVFLNSETSGGSGVTCCVQVPRDSGGQLKVKIRWQFGGCLYIVSSPWSRETAELVHYFYKEEQVLVERISPNVGRYLETHFFADGTVRAFISNAISVPRVVRNFSSTNNENFHRCKNDQKPQ